MSAPPAAARALDSEARKRALADVPRPRGRVLDPGELERFAAEVAARPELWIELVAHDAERRRYEELLGDEYVNAWLICWMDEQDTGFHDHGVSSGGVAVLSGAVREDRLAIGGPPRSRVIHAGDGFSFAAADIHRVRHAGAGGAVTLHAYSPPLGEMGAYVVEQDGVLRRFTIPATEELRPQPARV